VDGESSQPLTVRVSATAYERLCERATRERRSVPAMVRHALDRWLVEDDERDDD
jgi:ribbon-helix-helix CopG family protein